MLKKKKSITAWWGNLRADLCVEPTEDVVCILVHLLAAASSQVYPQDLPSIVDPFRWWYGKKRKAFYDLFCPESKSQMDTIFFYSLSAL